MKNKPSCSVPAWFRAAGFTAVTFAVLCIGQTAFAVSAPSTTSGSAGNSGTMNDPNSNSPALKWADRHFITETADGNHEELVFAQLATQQASDPAVRAFAQQLMADHRQLGQELAQLAQQKGLALDGDLATWMPAVSVTSGSTAATAQGNNLVVPLGPSLSGSNMGSLTDTPTGNRIQATGTPVSPGLTQTSANPASDQEVLAMTGANGGTAADGTTRSTQYQYAGTSTTASNAPGIGWWDDRKYRRLAKMSGPDFDRDYIAMMVSDHEKEVKEFDKKSRDASDADVRAFAAKKLPTLQAHLDRAQSLAQTLR